jgi:hypothetical protein
VRPRQTENGEPQARGAGVEYMSACEHIVPPNRAGRFAASREKVHSHYTSVPREKDFNASDLMTPH